MRKPFFTGLGPAPIAQKRPLRSVIFGVQHCDDYAWLKDENWQDVMEDPSALSQPIRDHLDAENSYTADVMKNANELQKLVFAEMKGRIKDDDAEVPQPDGPFEYGERYRKGDEHGIHYRRPRKNRSVNNTNFKDDTNDVEILLDMDALAKAARADGQKYFDIGSAMHSDDHKRYAYTVDYTGSERFALCAFDIKTKTPLFQPIQNTSGDFEWSMDGGHVFWVQRDSNNRPAFVYRLDIEAVESKPELIYEEKDPGFFVSISRSDSGKFIEISAHDHTSGETRLIPADKPREIAQVAAPRLADREYSLHDHGDDFYILTNADDATDFKIVKCKQNACAPENWKPYIEHKLGTLILGVETYSGFLVRIERANALPRIVIRDLKTQGEHSIEFDEDAYSLGLLGGLEFDTDWLRFSYSSPAAPQQIFDYNMRTQERVLRKTDEVPSGHISSDYKTKRVSIKTRDGETVPVTLLMRADHAPDGKSPCLLYGYGSYGITIPASFRTSLLSLVDRGFVYAIAHVRGGKAKGHQWYLDGKLDKKQASFDDFVDCAKGLIDMGYTREGNVIAHGGSAGGLLVGAALNQAPGLFGGVIAAVPFVDVLNTMRDDSLPLTPPEWPEWGNPIESEEDYKRIAAYSPYDNIKPAHYPPVLITAGLTDPRVTYWEPAKWAAKLREHQMGSAPILLRTNMEAGHAGEAGRYDALKEKAFEYAFAIKAAGLD